MKNMKKTFLILSLLCGFATLFAQPRRFNAEHESSFRIETLFAQSKTIDDYRFALMDEMQKPADQQRLTKTRMLAKYSDKVIDDSNFMREYYASTANYEACMIGHLSPN